MQGTIALIDNSTSRLHDLLRQFFPGEVHLFQFTNLFSLDINRFDGIIMSGGNQYFLKGYIDKYKDEFALLRLFEGPVLGICMGFEIINHIYGGGYMEKLDHKVHGSVSVKMIQNDPLFLGMNNDELLVFESHIWSVSHVEDLEVLAVSDYGVEIVKVPGRPIYGTQFHPEVFVGSYDGQKLLSNFLSMVAA